MVCRLVVPKGTTMRDVNQARLRAVAEEAFPKRLKKGHFWPFWGGVNFSKLKKGARGLKIDLLDDIDRAKMNHCLKFRRRSSFPPKT
jgi:hypothetical protein